MTQAGPNSVQLNWGGAADNVAIYGYGIYQDGTRIRNVGAVTSFVLNNVPAGSHTYNVDATDSATPAAQYLAIEIVATAPSAAPAIANTVCSVAATCEPGAA